MENSCKILLVEDDENDMELIHRTLRNTVAGVELVHARDGQQAIDAAFTESQDSGMVKWCPFSLILLDLNVPKLNGFEVLHFIRSFQGLSFVPVVIFSSSNRMEDISQAYLLGANGYIQKPIDFDTFESVLREVAHYWLQVNLSPNTQLGREPLHIEDP